MWVVGCGAKPEPSEPVTVEIPEVSKTRASARPDPPAAELEEPATLDGFPHEADRRAQDERVSQVLSELRPRVNHCFLSHVPGLNKGRIRVSFVLERDGTSRDVELTPIDRNAALMACVVRVVGSTRFPTGTSAVRVEVPLKVGVP